MGLEWKGSENQEWDFTSLRRGSSNVFDYYAINRKNCSKRIKGEITVDLFGSKVKMTKTVHGKEVSVCDGIFFQ